MTVNSPFSVALSRIPIKRHEVVVDGIRTAYWEYGEGSADRTVVMIHGFRGDHHGLEPLVAEWGNASHILVPDLPGFGESSDFPNLATIDSYSQWLQEFIAQVSPQRKTFVVGHSFGSIIVASTIAQGLDIQSACLINPIAANALRGPRGLMTRLAVFYYRLAAALPERMGFALLRNSAIVRVMSVTMAKTKNRELRAWIHDQHDRYFSHFSTRQGVLSAFQTSVSTDVSEYASRISIPILLVAADLDDITALPEQEKLHVRLPQSSLRVVTGVGHLVHYEAPAFAVKCIQEFMSEH